jgi:hypothetical protein
MKPTIITAIAPIHSTIVSGARAIHRMRHLCFFFLTGWVALLASSAAATAEQIGTFVPNSFFEEFNVYPVDGGLVSTYARYWQGSSKDVVITTLHSAPGQKLGIWSTVFRGGSVGLGGDWNPDSAMTTPWIPVTPGKKYRLSGWLLRTDPADNVYLDFNDGRGRGGSFPDGHAFARSVHVWEFQYVDVQVGPWTTGVQVRCVRDGANRGNAHFDGLMIHPLN